MVTTLPIISFVSNKSNFVGMVSFLACIVFLDIGISIYLVLAPRIML